MDKHFGFKNRCQRYRFDFFIMIVFVSVHLPCFWLIAMEKDSLVKAGDKNGQLQARKISLDEAIRIAVEKNPQLQSARDQVDAAMGALRDRKSVV